MVRGCFDLSRVRIGLECAGEGEVGGTSRAEKQPLVRHLASIVQEAPRGDPSWVGRHLSVYGKKLEGYTGV